MSSVTNSHALALLQAPKLWTDQVTIENGPWDILGYFSPTKHG